MGRSMALVSFLFLVLFLWQAEDSKACLRFVYIIVAIICKAYDGIQHSN